MNKLFVTGLLALSTTGVALTSTAHAASNTRIFLDGSPFRTAVEPMTEDGRVLVPMRAIFEALGAQVDYDRADQTIRARRGPTVVRMAIGERRASVNQRPVRLDVPATAYDGRTLVPLRFVSEALGANVDYDSYRNVVTIDSGSGNQGNTADWHNGDHRGDNRGDNRNHDWRDRNNGNNNDWHNR